MNIATNFKQSEKLAEILPAESADMSYRIVNLNDGDDSQWHQLELCPHKYASYVSKPAWSLNTLFSFLPTTIKHEGVTYSFKMTVGEYDNGDRFYDVGYQGISWLEYETKEDLIDACVELIFKLKERNFI